MSFSSREKYNIGTRGYFALQLKTICLYIINSICIGTLKLLLVTPRYIRKIQYR